MADDWIGIDESTTIDKKVDAETVIFGTTTVYRERMQIAGATTGAIAPVSSAGGLTVDLGTNNDVVISGNSTAIVSTVSAIRVKSTATITVTGTSNVSGSTVVLTTASKVQVEPVTGSTFTVTGTSNVTIAGGQSTAILTTASKTLADISTALPAGTNNIGFIRTQKDVNTPVAGTTALTISRATISFATSGAQTIVSSVAGANIRILGWNLVTATTNVLTWFSATTAGTTLARPYHFAANGGISVPISEYGWMQTTAVGVGVVLKAEVASSIGGNVVYIQSAAI